MRVVNLHTVKENDQTSINGTNSVNINVTGNTDIKGAVIANIDSDGTSRATIGLGYVTALGSSSTSNINRDISISQESGPKIITAASDAEITLDHRLFSKDGQEEMKDQLLNLSENLGNNPLTPMGVSKIIEGYTGYDMTWERGGEARFKLKGSEFETSVVGANTIGKANTIDPKDARRLYLVGQPLSADPRYKGPEWNQEGGLISTPNAFPGFNSMSVLHDKFTQETFLGREGFLELSIIPSVPINYYGLIGKTIRNIYEEPKASNDLTGDAR